MKLVLTKGWTGTEELISDNPNEQEISELLKTLDWQQFNSVQLQLDSKNWIDVSGNLNQDGLAVVYEENGTQYVSDESPESISQLEEILKLFLRGDQNFKHIRFNSDSSTNTKTGYDLWKIQYSAKRKIQKRNFRIAIFIIIVILGFAGSITYLYSTDELRFIGHDVNYITTKVTQTKWQLLGNRYIQQVSYEFDYNGKRYTGYFEDYKTTGKHYVDDLIKVKFVTDDPTISKRVARIKRKY